MDFTNVLPTIDVTKTADQLEVYDPGEDATFTFVVKNTSTEEAVTITSLSDSVYDTLTGDADCQVGTVLAAGAECTFSITEPVTADHTNVFTAKAVDNDQSEAMDDDDATVEMINPSLTIVKTTNGGDGLTFLVGSVLTWSYQVTNNGDVTLTGITVTDNKLGPICTIATLAASDSTTCTQPGIAEIGWYTNTGTAKATYTDLDSDAKSLQASDGSSYFGAAPHLSLTKTAVPTTYSAALQVIQYTLVATNDGNVPLSSVSISDPKLGTLSCTACPAGHARDRRDVDLHRRLHHQSGRRECGHYRQGDEYRHGHRQLHGRRRPHRRRHGHRDGHRQPGSGDGWDPADGHHLPAVQHRHRPDDAAVLSAFRLRVLHG